MFRFVMLLCSLLAVGASTLLAQVPHFGYIKAEASVSDLVPKVIEEPEPISVDNLPPPVTSFFNPAPIPDEPVVELEEDETMMQATVTLGEAPKAEAHVVASCESGSCGTVLHHQHQRERVVIRRWQSHSGHRATGPVRRLFRRGPVRGLLFRGCR